MWVCVCVCVCECVCVCAEHNNYVTHQQRAIMERSVSLVGQLLRRDEWRCVTTTCMAQCVMTSGMSWRPEWSVSRSVIQKLQELVRHSICMKSN